jgi:hypothetical protein
MVPRFQSIAAAATAMGAAVTLYSTGVNTGLSVNRLTRNARIGLFRLVDPVARLNKEG